MPSKNFCSSSLRDAGEEAGVGDLVAVQVEDREYAPVSGRIEELVAVPAGCEGSGLRLAVADDTGDDQVRVVERRPIGVAQGVPKLAPLVNAARRLGATWLGMPPGKLNCLNSFRIPSASWLISG